MADPRVSIVVATRNRADLLARLLRSLARLESPPGGYETVIVDDGSTDDTLAVLKAAEVRFVSGAQQGPGAARNHGWAAAAGQIIVFTDDDCVPDPSWLVDVALAFDAYPEAAGIGGKILPLTHGFVEDFAHVERLADHGRGVDGSVRYLVTANAAYRRAALETVGGFDETFAKPAGEDVDLSERIVEACGPLVVVPGGVVRHDYRPGVGPLLRTYYRHGEARFRLQTRHRSLGLGAPTRAALRPHAWSERYHRYQASVGNARAVGYAGLRVAGSAAFVAGLTTAKLRSRAA